MSASQEDPRVATSLEWLQKRGTKRNRDGMARYGIVAPKSFGVSMATMQPYARKLGRDHELALALWDTEWLEARMLAAFVDEPERITSRQMDQWARDFDNWAICDTVCFKLFDQTPHAWKKIDAWSRRSDEFVKRAAFALLASVALHRKKEADAPFVKSLAIIEREASDSRNFVKKGVSWSLRSIGHRNANLNARAQKLAGKLSESTDATERWIGKDVLRDITRPQILKRFK
ncbi:MAG TPA: DNA alkylation repair protein [Gemmatimonadaceae bacterium]|jgi:3-methyladenine DNA glycosylase AlkD|nr:DNA alkylation repair protein [Gemmatimonadaceae bacterium]